MHEIEDRNIKEMCQVFQHNMKWNSIQVQSRKDFETFSSKLRIKQTWGYTENKFLYLSNIKVIRNNKWNKISLTLSSTSTATSIKSKQENTDH
jgi:hypothetical protein